MTNYKTVQSAQAPDPWRRIQERAGAMNYGRIEVIIQAGQVVRIEVLQQMKIDALSMEQDGVIQL